MQLNSWNQMPAVMYRSPVNSAADIRPPPSARGMSPTSSLLNFLKMAQAFRAVCVAARLLSICRTSMHVVPNLHRTHFLNILSSSTMAVYQGLWPLTALR